MLKRLGLLLLSLLPLLACGAFRAEAAEPDHNKNVPSSIEKSVPSVDNNSENPTDQDTRHALELALKTISLSQGEGGIELWRLKAEWASMRKEDGKIVVQRPTLTYFMPEKDNNLLITSDSGLIDQKEQLLQFIDNVRISQADKHIQGKLLVYNGTAATMTFPQGGKFTSAAVFGDAAFLVWDVNRKIIRAEGGILVRFASSESPTPLTPEQEQ